MILYHHLLTLLAYDKMQLLKCVIKYPVEQRAV